MSIRLRLALAATLAVAIAVAAASGAVYLVERHQLRNEVDQQLARRAVDIAARGVGPDGAPGPFFFHDAQGAPFGDAASYLQLVTSDGRVVRPPSESTAIPVGTETLAVARGRRPGFFSDATVSGTHVRVLTVPVAQGVALQLVRSLDMVDRTLHRLRLVLLLIGLSGIGLAVVLGGVVAHAVLRPVRRLTETTEHVTRTRDLGQRLQARGRDELSRLATSFNAMLEALSASVSAQRQLVADASHELRTPLTSVRTNVEVLRRRADLSAEQRDEILGDVVTQLEEMTALVGDVIELAREAEREEDLEDVQLDVLVERAVERAQRLAPQVRFETALEPSVVRGAPGRLERAVANLLDNAAKWSPAGGVVEVRVENGEVRVRDHGPGIDEADLPFVFDRFYRAADARRLPGSGLGLAIVRQIAEAHGGTATAEQAEGGGALLRLSLPPVEPPPPESPQQEPHPHRLLGPRRPEPSSP